MDLCIQLLREGPASRFPALVSFIKDTVVGPVLDRQEKLAASRIRDVLESEECYVWTDDNKFIESVRKIVQSGGDVDASNIRAILVAYYTEVRAAIANIAPKLIMKFLVYGTTTELTQALFGNLPRDAVSIETMATESGAAGERRARLVSDHACLEQAVHVLTTMNS